MDGNDALVGTQVFRMLNSVYQSQDVWYVYTNYMDVEFGTVGVSRKIPEHVAQKNTYRQYVTADVWITSHLRTFYTELLRRIPD